ncbi:MAG: exonuclease domain-containing protein [Capnocytophaga sp.]|nr:exonuclease domain-containing protein [Capnocytophaga sp.]
MYAIIDIETTGGKLNEEGITEIAIYRFDGQQVTDRFITLINPEKKIQEFVVQLTGINNAMLRNAPKFYEVAKRIVEITQDCVIVAHNADFDYRVLRNEYNRLGFDYQRNTICTVQMAQRLLPGQLSYSLGKLAKALGIPLSNRHRASGDALATLYLFKLLLTKDISKTAVNEFVKQNIGKQLSSHLLSILDEVPSKLGVYYIYNEKGNIIFIGKANNLKKKINQHFVSNSTKDTYIQKHIAKVISEQTGTELIASLKEFEELDKNKPALNGKKINKKYPFGLFSTIDKNGYIRLYISLIANNLDYLAIFESQSEGLNFLFELTEEFSLCTKLNGFSQSRGNCYNYSIGKCFGACTEKELPDLYNDRVKKALEKYTLSHRTFVILDKGRSVEERSVILVENGKCLGYGFINLNYQLTHIEILKNIITPIRNTFFVQHSIQNHLRKNKYVKIISF